MPAASLKNGRYEILETLGRSGTAAVYRCYDTVARREVALKLILGAPEKSAAEAFFRECNVLASLRHPNILEILDAGELEDAGAKHVYLTTPVAPGVTLERLIARAGAGLPVSRAVDIMVNVCRGLQAAHERGVAHRDLRPANIFVSENGGVEISDFAVARLTPAALAGGNWPVYAAPEQIQGKPATALSDIFAAGATAYHALSGNRPFEGADAGALAEAILHGCAPDLSERNPAVNRTLAQVVHKALAKQAWHRFASARDLADALERAGRNEPLAALDPARIRPRLESAAQALAQGDAAGAASIVAALEEEGWLDPAIRELRRSVERAPRPAPAPPEVPPPAAQTAQASPPPPPDNSALIAEVDRRVAAEADPARRVEMMRVAAERFPNEPHFQLALAALRRARDDASAASLQAAAGAPPAPPEPDIESIAIEGRALCSAGRFDEGMRLLGRAYDRDKHNALVRAALCEALVSQSGALLETDLARAAQLVSAALSIEPSNTEALKLRAIVEERRRDQEIQLLIAQAQKRHLTGDPAGALAQVEESLARYPGAMPLVHYQELLRKTLDEAAYAAPPDPGPTRAFAAAAVDEPANAFPAPVPAAPDAGTSGRGTEPSPTATPPAGAAPPPPVAGPRRGPPWKLIGITAAAALAVIALIGGVVKLSRPGATPASALVALDVRTNPPGASVLVNQKQQGTSNCRLHLPPGNYEVQAVLPGYRPGVAALVLRAGVPGVVDLALDRPGAALRIFTDLDPARLTIDGQKPVEFQGGQFVLDRLPEGPHKLQITGAHGEATVPLEVPSAGPPKVTGGVTAREVAAIVVSNAGAQVSISTSLRRAKAMVDGKPAGETGPAGLELKGVTPGGHELAIGEGKDHRKVSFETGVNPSVTAFVNSDRNAGTLVVAAGEDGAAVWIDGKQQRRVTKGGQLRIPNLAVKQYSVRVSKPGFQDVAEQRVEIGKGEDSRVVFQLKPVPTVASLVIEGAVPGAQVLVDGNPAGTVGADGGFSMPNVAPGEHTLELRKEQYRPRSVVRGFPAGQSIKLSGADVALELIPKPPEPKPVPKPAPVAKAAPAVAKVGMEGWANPGSWEQNGVWQMHRGGEFVLFRSTPAGGTFVFTVMLQRGKRLRWVVRHAGEKNHVLFEMDDKNFYRKVVANGKTNDLLKQPHGLGKQKNLTCALEIRVAAGRVQQRIGRGESWTVLDDWSDPNGRFTDGPFGFLVHGKDEIGITNFSFSAAP